MLEMIQSTDQCVNPGRWMEGVQGRRIASVDDSTRFLTVDVGGGRIQNGNRRCSESLAILIVNHFSSLEQNPLETLQ